jgi:predicted XRE-type DNA-binding protein
MPRTPRTKTRVESLIPKARLARAIASAIDELGLTQTEAAWRINDHPSQISLVATGKLNGFSAERLLRMLIRLGRDLEMTIRPAKGKKAGQVRVTFK